MDRPRVPRSTRRSTTATSRPRISDGRPDGEQPLHRERDDRRRHERLVGQRVEPLPGPGGDVPPARQVPVDAVGRRPRDEHQPGGPATRPAFPRPATRRSPAPAGCGRARSRSATRTRTGSGTVARVRVRCRTGWRPPVVLGSVGGEEGSGRMAELTQLVTVDRHRGLPAGCDLRPRSVSVPVTAMPSVASRSWLWTLPSTVTTTWTGSTALIATWTPGPAVACVPPPTVPVAGLERFRNSPAAARTPRTRTATAIRNRQLGWCRRSGSRCGRAVFSPLAGPGAGAGSVGLGGTEVLVERHQHPVGVQTQVCRVRAEESPDVDVAGERVVALALERLEVLGPDTGLTARFLDRFSLPETSLPQNGSNAGALHNRTFRIPGAWG